MRLINPCKKCLVQPSCTQHCDDRDEYTVFETCAKWSKFYAVLIIYVIVAFILLVLGKSYIKILQNSFIQFVYFGFVLYGPIAFIKYKKKKDPHYDSF